MLASLTDILPPSRARPTDLVFVRVASRRPYTPISPCLHRASFKNPLGEVEPPSASIEDISAASDLIALLTLHEEDLLKHLMDLNWKTGRESHVYRFFDDPYHKLDANGHIMLPVHVPYMMT